MFRSKLHEACFSKKMSKLYRMKNFVLTALIMGFLIVLSLSTTGCNRYGCPAEIQQTKVKKKKKISKNAKTNLFPESMRKNSKQIN